MLRLQRGDSGSVTVTFVSSTAFVFVTLIVNLAVPSTRVVFRVWVLASILRTTFVSRVCIVGLLTIAIDGAARATSVGDAVASELSATTAQTGAAVTRNTTTTAETWAGERPPRLIPATYQESGTLTCGRRRNTGGVGTSLALWTKLCPPKLKPRQRRSDRIASECQPR